MIIEDVQWMDEPSREMLAVAVCQDDPLPADDPDDAIVPIISRPGECVRRSRNSR